MKCSTSKLAKNGQKLGILDQPCGAGGYDFHRKIKIKSFQSTTFDILKDVKGCKETISR